MATEYDVRVIATNINGSSDPSVVVTRHPRPNGYATSAPTSYTCRHAECA